MARSSVCKLYNLYVPELFLTCAIFKANGACLDQCLLENILRKHLAKYGIIVELRKNLVAISQDADNLTATVTSSAPGSTETRETIIAQYLVGADGARGASPMVSSAYFLYTSYHLGSCRKLLGLTFEGETRDADGIVSGEAEIKNLSNNVRLIVSLFTPLDLKLTWRFQVLAYVG